MTPAIWTGASHRDEPLDALLLRGQDRAQKSTNADRDARPASHRIRDVDRSSQAARQNQIAGSRDRRQIDRWLRWRFGDLGDRRYPESWAAAYFSPPRSRDEKTGRENSARRKRAHFDAEAYTGRDRTSWSSTPRGKGTNLVSMASRSVQPGLGNECPAGPNATIRARRYRSAADLAFTRKTLVETADLALLEAHSAALLELQMSSAPSGVGGAPGDGVGGENGAGASGGNEG